jgi:iron complex outermembrane receptor protein
VFTADPGIGVYLDGVYLARTFGALFDFLDVERVEVLRGPQGTLFGRNTPGGAILVSTALPPRDFGGMLDISYGRFNEVVARGTVGGPLVEDRLSASVSALHRRRDGIAEAPNIGRDVNRKEITALRGQLLGEPTERVRLRVMADHTWDNSDASVPTSVFTGRPSNLYLTLANEDPGARFRTWGLALNADFDLGPWTIGVNSAYRELFQDALLDNDGEARRLSAQKLTANQNQFSQEVTLSLDTETLKGIVGAFLFREYNDYATITFIGSRTNPAVRIERPDFSIQKTRSEALFGQFTWRPVAPLGLTVGARYTWDAKDFENRQPSVPAVFTGSERWRNFSPKIGLDWQADDRILLFGSWAKGYKAGGFNRSNIRVVAETPYDPEIVESWEFGLKADLANRRLRANLTLFHNDYTDLQLSSFDPNTGTTRRFNAASATTKGIELELAARPSRRFDAYASIGYLDARYNEFFDLVGGVLTDVSDRALKGAPELQWSAGFGWTPDIGLPGELRIGGDASFRDFVFNNVANTRLIATEARTLVNASVRYTTGDGRWAFTLAGRNLLDEQYPANGIFIGGLLAAVYPADPRSWSISARFRF